MSNRHVLLAAVMGVSLAGTSAMGAVLGPPTDSATFAYKYEGDLLPTDPAYAALTFSAQGNAVGNIANIVSLGTEGPTDFIKIDTNTNEAAGESFYYEIDGETAANPVWAPPAQGDFTVEFRVRARPTNDLTLSNTVQTGDINSSGNQQFYHDHFIADNGTQVNFTSDTTNFHTYRIASYSPDDLHPNQLYVVFRDGVQIASVSPNTSFNQRFLRFGDIISGATEVNFDLDYLRWDLTGAYQPIPEPSSALGLIAAGAGMLLRRRNGSAR